MSVRQGRHELEATRFGPCRSALVATGPTGVRLGRTQGVRRLEQAVEHLVEDRKPKGRGRHTDVGLAV